MRHVMLAVVVALISAAALPSAQGTGASKDPLVGSWAGTYDGDGTGKFTMSIARDAASSSGERSRPRPKKAGATRRRSSPSWSTATPWSWPTTRRTTADSCSLMGPSTARRSRAPGSPSTGSGNVVASGGFTSAKQ